MNKTDVALLGTTLKNEILIKFLYKNFKTINSIMSVSYAMLTCALSSVYSMIIIIYILINIIFTQLSVALVENNNICKILT